VARKITEKFKNPSVEGISFCNIAAKAHQAGRDDLAIKLLELEPRASLHVPLLLKMRKFDRAVGSATQSGDTELIIQVLLEMKMHMMLSNLHVRLFLWLETNEFANVIYCPLPDDHQGPSAGT